jgi:hypothetical protein
MAISGATRSNSVRSVTRYTGIRAASTTRPTAVAVATKVSFSVSNASNAADRIPPWFPTSPPNSPERAPAIHAPRRPKRTLVINPVSSDTAANSRRHPNRIASARLDARPCNSVPSSPPAALARPNQRKTRRSTWARSSQKRSAVAATWGIETVATASLVPSHPANSGVSTLSTPKPAIDAIAPATKAASAIARSRNRRCWMSSLQPVPTRRFSAASCRR